LLTLTSLPVHLSAPYRWLKDQSGKNVPIKENT